MSEFNKDAVLATIGQVCENRLKESITQGITRGIPRLQMSDEERAERRAAYQKKRDEAWATYHAAVPALDAISDPVARLVLDLHAPKARHTRTDWVFAPECGGCEFGGYEGEPPNWPCGTTAAIADHYGIALPNPWHLDSHATQADE